MKNRTCSLYHLVSVVLSTILVAGCTLPAKRSTNSSPRLALEETCSSIERSAPRGDPFKPSLLVLIDLVASKQSPQEKHRKKKSNELKVVGQIHRYLESEGYLVSTSADLEGLNVSLKKTQLLHSDATLSTEIAAPHLQRIASVLSVCRAYSVEVLRFSDKRLSSSESVGLARQIGRMISYDAPSDSVYIPDSQASEEVLEESEYIHFHISLQQ